LLSALGYLRAETPKKARGTDRPHFLPRISQPRDFTIYSRPQNVSFLIKSGGIISEFAVTSGRVYWKNRWLVLHLAGKIYGRRFECRVLPKKAINPRTLVKNTAVLNYYLIQPQINSPAFLTPI